MKKLTTDDYVRALEKMKKSTRDRVGILGELGVTGIGAAAGFALSGSIAAAAGAATLAGSTTLATIMGGVFVTTTPVGWVAGFTIAGGALGYALKKGVRSGAKCDTYKEINIRKLEERIQKLRHKAENHPGHNKKMKNVITSIQYLVSNSHMTQDKATDLLAAIEKKRMSVDEAFEILQEVVKEKSISGGDDAQQITPEDV